MNLIKQIFSKFKNKKVYISTLMIAVILLITLFVTKTIAVDDTPGNSAFDDANFYQCVIDVYNTQNRTQKTIKDNLTDEELQTITYLICMGLNKQDNEKIKSVKGLEKLTKLTNLDLIGNNLSGIDVTANTKLTNLELGSNNLSGIDVTANTKLINLDLGYNNINEINVSLNTELKTLKLGNNNLSKIDVTANTKLTELDLGYNDINEIDVSRNIELTNLNLMSNNLSEIDVRANTKLTNLRLYGNNLSEIDVSLNTKLTYLELSNNNLSEINVSQNAELTNLELSSNNLSAVDVRANTKLTMLNLNFNDINEIDASQNTDLIRLELRDNNLSEINVNNNIKLESLILDNNNIDKIDLSLNNKLKYLALSNNKLKNINLINNLDLEAVELENNHFLSLNLSNLTKLKTGDIGGGALYSNRKPIITPQSVTLTIYNDRKLNLREYDSELIPSKVIFTSIDGVTYDNLNGIFTFNDKVKKITYTYKTGLPESSGVSEDMQVDLTIQYAPKIKTFYVGGSSNPKYATSTLSSVYLDWDDNDVKQYCISTTSSSDGCAWKTISGTSLTVDYTLTNDDGTKTLYAFLKNNNGLISEVKSDEIILDTTAPTINSFYIGGNNNPEYATSTSSSIYLTWNDVDVKQYCISSTSSSDGCDWKPTNGKSVTASYNLASSNGIVRIYAYLKDEAGHISKVKEDSIKVDTIKPTIDKFYVGGDSNPDFITDTNTSVYLSWNDEDVVSYCINTTNSTNGCNWHNTSNKSVNDSYTLTGSNGNKTLYAFIKDKAGNISKFKEDNVKLDSIKPIIETFYIGGESNPENATDTNSTIYLTWQDDDVVSFCISTTNSSSNCEWRNASGKKVNAEYILPGKNGKITLYAFIKDSAGLISNSIMDTITLNTTKPLIETFYIGGNSNPKYATSTNSNIYLQWTEENITDYCISTTNSSDNCNWQNTREKSINISYTLTNGDGIKRIYAYIKHESGLISNVASDSIILDTTSPTIDKFYIGGINNPKYINNINPNIYATWQDTDVISYCLNIIDDVSKCEWQNISGNSLDTKYSLTSKNEEKKLYLYIKDEAEHISEVKEDSTILDTEVPVIKEFYIGDKNSTKVTNTKTKVTITHEDDNIESYCISTTNGYSGCNWVKANNKKIEAEYTLPIGNGEKTLYAFIKDKAGNVSLVKEAKIILESNSNANENGVDTPLNNGPQTGAITIGVITILILIGAITYYLIIKRKNKLYKL